MGAGKTTLGAELARRLGRAFVDTDSEVVGATGRSIAELFEEGRFREVEQQVVSHSLGRRRDSVIALGGGAVAAEPVRSKLEGAFVLWIDVGPDEAWERVEGSDRPLARDRASFHRLHAERSALYAQVADARVRTVDEAVLACAAVHVEQGALARLGELVPGEGPVALVTDARVAGIHGAEAQLALGDRLASVHELPHGEAAKTVAACEALWRELALERSGTVVALGGGCTTDAAGFAAAAYLRGLPWVAVPTTLVGQVDAAIGGKTAVNLPEGKNLVGAFHWPVRTIVDPALLATLPAEERRGGLAEVVKTGLLAGEPLWELSEPEQVRRSAAFKAAVCLRDPLDRGERAILNLGHTFAHALEAAAGYQHLGHGRAVALGLLAALRLSGLDTTPVEEALAPKPARVDRERAWAALRRDKKAQGGRIRLVLLEAPGEPRWAVERSEAEVRRALNGIIAD